MFQIVGAWPTEAAVPATFPSHPRAWT